MVAHGQDGWTLEDYEWDPATGVGTYLYSRREPGTSVTTHEKVAKAQPYAPMHTGWVVARATMRF